MNKYSFLNILLWIGWPSSLALGVVLLFFTCTSRNEQTQTGDIKNEDDRKKEFRMVNIPNSITTPVERAGYLATNYWSNFDFSDTTFIHLPEVLEQAFVGYIDLLPHATPETAAVSIGRTLEKARNTPAIYGWFKDMYEKYLYDANSPFREEEYYAMVLEHILKHETDETSRIRPTFQLAEINKNRKGSIAANFSYALPDGTKGRLHSISSEYTLLFFFYPGCADCKRTKEILEQIKEIAGLTIIALYPDNDLTEWTDYQKSIPQSWINARDASQKQEIKNKLYSIRAIPSLYLLDKDKRVLLKDATVEQVLSKMTDYWQ